MYSIKTIGNFVTYLCTYKKLWSKQVKNLVKRHQKITNLSATSYTACRLYSGANALAHRGIPAWLVVVGAAEVLFSLAGVVIL